ncbi:sulfatase-like hydrolase/transferase [Granulicella sp. L56]|uniref:sulfatase-like hydrolase/transferase n=1 Tax=Acidobacteriaceae TaxID=204434 RepID=UPI00131C1F4A
MFKHYTDEGGIATPLIAWSPKYVSRENALEHTPAHVMDLHPTLLRLAGGTYPEILKASQPFPWLGKIYGP